MSIPRVLAAHFDAASSITSDVIDAAGYSYLSLAYTRATTSPDLGETVRSEVLVNGDPFAVIEQRLGSRDLSDSGCPRVRAAPPQHRLKQPFEYVDVSNIVLTGDNGSGGAPNREDPPTGQCSTIIPDST